MEINWKEQEYKHLTTELARYEKISQGLISFVTIIFTLVFTFGEKYSLIMFFP